MTIQGTSKASPDLFGVDACKGGWYAVKQDGKTGAVTPHVYRHFEALLSSAPAPAIIAVDVPIGLSSKGTRACDSEARRRLKSPRTSSVFPTPVRQTLRAASYREACDMNRNITGNAITQQAYNILAKIRQVDTLLRASDNDARRVFEVHPELAFMQLQIEHGGPAGGVMASKRKPEGRNRRKDLLTTAFSADDIDRALGKRVPKEAGFDDILDAFAALWSARRIANNTAYKVPAVDHRDDFGLTMSVRY